jgi:uncharacterized membrane protein
MKRIYSIDLTRGIVMIIMALDHVRDLMHVHAIGQSPTDLGTTTPILFFTRWITHLCAPTFVFLAGTSAYLSFKNKNDIFRSRQFLLKRGLWLILVEITILNFGLFFDPAFHTIIFIVIAAIGTGFIILSLLLKLSYKTIGIIGLIIICCHDLMTIFLSGPAGAMAPGSMGENSFIKTILTPLFALKFFPISSSHFLIIAYPPIPWLGIMLVGYSSGKLFELPEVERKTIFMKIGVGALLLFVLLRFINIYGDPFPWSTQKSMVYTFLSFMDITKQPPSLLFCLATLGIMFLILAMAEKVKNRFTNMVYVYGKVPLFYYVVHFYVIHCILIILLFLQGFHWADLDFVSGTYGRPKGVESGIPLWGVYIIWVAIVMAMYKPCVWFGRYKAENKYWWLSYI